MKKTKKISIIFIAFGIALLIPSIFSFNNTRDFVINGTKTKAKVVELIKFYDDEDDELYTPVFEYKNEFDEIVNFKSNTSSNPPAYKIGEIEDIIFMPNTNKVKVDSIWGLYDIVIVLVVFSVTFLIIGIFLWVAPNKIIESK